MSRIVFILIAGWSAFALGQSSSQWDILVLPLYHEDTLDIDHPGYRGIESAITQGLHNDGHAVYNKDAIGFDLDCTRNDCGASGRSALIDRIRELNRDRRRTG